MSGPIRIESPQLGYASSSSRSSSARRSLCGGAPIILALISSIFLLLTLSSLPHYRQLPIQYPISRTYSIPAPPPADPPYELLAPFHAPGREEFRAAVLARLTALLEQQIAGHNASLERQTELCPNAQVLVDKDHFERNVGWWEAVEVEELAGMRERVAERLTDELGWAPSAPTLTEDGRAHEAPSAWGEESLTEWRSRFGNGGRGLVYTAGNSDTIARLLISLTMIRKDYGCDLPVEIFVFPDEMDQLEGTREKQRVDELGGVVWRTASVEKSTVKDGGGGKQFQIKGEAVVRSSFSEVLLLDSDNVPTRDPSFLFHSPLYLEKGYVVWPDFARQSAANAIWRTLGRDCDPRSFTAESGQLLVNKLGQGGWNLVALLATRAMQVDHETWFRLSNGDKDTFRYGAWFAGVDYTPAPHYLAAAGSTVQKTKGGHTFCGKAMVQYGLGPEEWDDLPLSPGYAKPTNRAPPLFVHANLLKEGEAWIPIKKMLGNAVFGKIKALTGFGFDYHLGNTFTHLKFVDEDRVNEPSRLLDEDLRYKVIGCRGVGTDIWDSAQDDLEGFGFARGHAESVRSDHEELEDGETPLGLVAKQEEVQAQGNGGVQVAEWDDAFEGVLRGFEERFYAAMGQSTL